MQLSAIAINPQSTLKLKTSHFVVQASVVLPNSKTVSFQALVDSGATGYAFIDSSFAHTHSFPLESISPHRLNVVDGRESSAGLVNRMAHLPFAINSHTEQNLPCYVTKLGQYPLILGKPWLEQHDPDIRWASNSMAFGRSEHCRANCLPPSCRSLLIHGVSPRRLPAKPIIHDSTSPAFPVMVGAAVYHRFMNDRNFDCFQTSIFDIDMELKRRSAFPLELPSPPPRTYISRHTSPPDNPVYIDPISKLPFGVALMELALASTEWTNYTWRSRERAAASAVPPPPDEPLADFLVACAASTEDVEKALRIKTPVDPATIVPTWLHPLLPAWSVEDANLLPPHRDCDHEILLQPGTEPPWGPLYPMSVNELLVLKKFLTENLSKGFIRISSSPASSPVLFARKPGGGLRFCVDYRGLNAITIKDRYPIPLLQETLDRLAHAKIYTKLDVIAAFNKIRIKDGHEWMTAFRTRYGLFESLVMPFGLSNAPATFQKRINSVLRPYLDVFCTAYIDDVLVYSNDVISHRKHVSLVVKALMEAGLQLDVAKCEFEVEEVKYLGLIVSKDGVKMDPAKVAAIVDWHKPGNLRDIQAFLGFANFYRRFIRNFSKIVVPLVQLTHKDVRFDFNSACETAFATLKSAFTSAPILLHFDPSKEVIIECDASDFVSAGVLSQVGPDGLLHPVAFLSKKHSPEECNYEIYDKELLAIVRCFEDWRPELEGLDQKITVLTDHKNLQYFMTTKSLSRRQVRWNEFLSRFDFEIRPIPGVSNGKADALTRRSGDLPQDATDPRKEHQNQTVLKPANLSAEVIASLPNIPFDLSSATVYSDYSHFRELNWEAELAASPAILEDIDIWEESTPEKIRRLLTAAYLDDAFFEEISEKLGSDSVQSSRIINLSEAKVHEGWLYYRDRLYVPLGNDNIRTFLIQTIHDQPLTGHPGKNKMFELVTRSYWWPTLWKDIDTFRRACHGCHRDNPSRLLKSGLLKPLPVPSHRWKDLSIDFIGPLPVTKEGDFDAIVVVVDRLSKDKVIVECNTTVDSAQLAKLLVRHVFCLHGLPDTIVSDRGPQFISALWSAVCHRLRIRINLSTAHHPESDGQTERANQDVERFLRAFVNVNQDDWNEWLPMCQFALSTTVNSTTGVTPFFANNAYHPRMDFDAPKVARADASATVLAGNFAGNEYVRKMEEITQVLKDNMRAAQETHERNANKKRRPSPLYRVGDMVYLSSKNIVSERPSHKLDHRYHGPFKVLSVHSHHCRLDLPHEMALIHHSRNYDMIIPGHGDGMPGQTNPPPPPIGVSVAGDELWGIETLLDSRRTKDGFDYLVRWRGYDSSHDSWEPLANVVDAVAATRPFHASKPRAKKPTKMEIKATRGSNNPTQPPAITPSPSIQKDIPRPALPLPPSIEPAPAPVRKSSRQTKKKVCSEDILPTQVPSTPRILKTGRGLV